LSTDYHTGRRIRLSRETGYTTWRTLIYTDYLTATTCPRQAGGAKVSQSTQGFF
jgi:hypothetical protein